MKQTVKQGEHDFKPNEINLHFGNFDLIWKVGFTPSCWYDSLGEDNADWNKAGGIGKMLTANNKDAVLLGWRPFASIPGVFQAVIYINDSKGGFYAGLHFRIEEGQEAWMRVRRKGSTLTVSAGYIDVKTNQMFHADVVEQKMTGILRERGAWFGGNQTAPHDMELWVSKTKFK